MRATIPKKIKWIMERDRGLGDLRIQKADFKIGSIFVNIFIEHINEPFSEWFVRVRIREDRALYEASADNLPTWQKARKWVKLQIPRLIKLLKTQPNLNKPSPLFK